MAKQANSPKLRALNVEKTLLAEDVLRQVRTRLTDVQFEQEVLSTLSRNYIVIRTNSLQMN
jgi:hypothetical protein